MPFTCSKTVMPVLPKPNHIKEGGISESIPLSAIEDKELRKKLRNRQSALAARERKKARMLELEKQVVELQECSRRLEEENDYLHRKLELMIRKCILGGMSLDNDKDLLQIAQPFLNQEGYMIRSNSEMICQAYKRKRGISKTDTICHKRQGMSIKDFMQQNNRAVNSNQQHHQQQTEYGLPLKPQANKEVMATAATAVSFENPTISMQKESNSKPVCQKPFITLRHSAQKLENSPTEQKEYSPFKSFKPIQTYPKIQQSPNEDHFKSPLHYHVDTTSYNNPQRTTTRTSQTSFDQNAQAVTYDNSPKSSMTHFLPSIGAMLGSTTECQRKDFYTAPEPSHNAISNETLLQNDQRLVMPIQVKPERTVGSLKESQRHTRQPNEDISLSSYNGSSCSFPSVPTNRPRKTSMELTRQTSSHECHDFNFNAATSENPQNFLETNLSEIFTPSGDEGKGNTSVFNLQDINLRNDSVGSPSSKSGSDFSIDEHLNWVNDNLVFAF